MKEGKGVHTQLNTNLSSQKSRGVITESQEVMIGNDHGKKVKHYRMSKGLTQEYMADKMGISSAEYTEIEKRKSIDEDSLAKIAKILNLGIEWLKDIPISIGIHNYYQDGNGSYYQNTGDAHHSTTINQPVEEVVRAYEKTIRKIEQLNERSILEKEQLLEDLRSELRKEKESRESLLIKLSDRIIQNN